MFYNRVVEKFYSGDLVKLLQLFISCNGNIWRIHFSTTLMNSIT
ncbi:hypothetical protein LEP1GSC166_3652 [Leptospira kirschneri]|nr:hypothetical protein LEP1GSC166_3652 [Leptospira kirschneri]